MNPHSMMTDWIHANAAHPADAIIAGVECEVTIAAAENAADGKPKPRTFSMNAYNGGAMRVAGWQHPVVIDLAGLETGQSSRPILIDHVNDLEHLLGQTDTVTKTASNLQVAGRIHAKSPTAKQVVELHDDGFKFQSSVGARVLNNEFVPAGQTADANGRTFHGPVNVARKSVLGEVSFVRLGADDSTSARIAAKSAEGSVMKFEQWLKAKGFDLATLSDAQKASLQAMFDAEVAAAAASGKNEPGKTGEAGIQAGGGAGGPLEGDDPIKAIRAAHAAENKRIGAINAAHAQFGNKHPDVIAEAIEAGWTPEATKLKLYEVGSPRVQAGAGASGNRDQRSSLNAAVVLAAACLNIGITAKTVEADIPAAQREQVMNEAVSAKYRGFGLHSIMDSTIAAAGDHFQGSRKSDSYIRAAFEADRMIRADGFSSMSLSNILSNVANKQLIDSYTAVETVWQYIAAIRSNSDFKPVNRYRLDSGGAFKKVGPDGELKHATLTDAGFVNQLETFGTMLALTRQMMINDDLGAFLQLPQLLGRMAALRIEEAVFVTLLSNPSSFFSGGNALSGAGSALSLDAITDAEEAFRDQVDSNGKPILTSPKILLVPTTLKVTADNIFRSQLLITGESKTKPADNPHAGKYQPYTSPYLNNTAIKDQDGKAISGQSDTAWYLLADPKVRAAIAVAFLNGQQTPTIESGQADFSQLGMQWRAYHDFGIGMEDPNAAVQSAGA